MEYKKNAAKCQTEQEKQENVDFRNNLAIHIIYSISTKKTVSQQHSRKRPLNDTKNAQKSLKKLTQNYE